MFIELLMLIASVGAAFQAHQETMSKSARIAMYGLISCVLFFVLF